jgi:hypothetical protein
MTDPERADLLTAITDLCQQYPEWRLGQLIANVAGWADEDIWDVEDDQLLEAVRSHLQQSRGTASATSGELAERPIAP